MKPKYIKLPITINQVLWNFLTDFVFWKFSCKLCGVFLTFMLIKNSVDKLSSGLILPIIIRSIATDKKAIHDRENSDWHRSANKQDRL